MKHILLAFILLFSLNIFAQDVIIKDSETFKTVGGVAVFDSELKTNAISLSNGTVNLNEFKEDEYITFQHISYQDYTVLKKEINTSIIYLKPKTQGLDEVVISVSKFTERRKEIPKTIATVSAKAIAFSNPQTSADLLGITGKVYIQKSQLGGGSPIIRGFSTNRLLINVDGVRMNNAIFRSGNLQNVISVDPFSIQSTEVTLGAGTVIYGSDAVGGVMSFNTIKPKISYKDSLVVSGKTAFRYSSSSQENTGHLSVQLSKNKWASYSALTYSKFGDLRMGSNGPHDYLRPTFVNTVNGVDTEVVNSNSLLQKESGYNQINAMQKIAYSINNRWNLDLGAFYTQTSNVPRYDRLLRRRNGNLRSAEWYYGPQSWFMTNLSATHTPVNTTLFNKLKTTIAYQNFGESRNDRDFNSSTLSKGKESVRALSLSVDLEKKFTPNTRLYYGLEIIDNKVKSKAEDLNIITGTSVNTVSRYPNNSKWRSFAVYTNLKQKLSKTVNIETGLRYNRVNVSADFTENNVYLNLPFTEAKNMFNALTGAAGLNWSVNKTIQWKANFSTAFRAPNIDDIGKVFDSEPGSVVVPNNNLKPEYAYNGELGLNLNFGKVFQLDVAHYITFLDNALVRADYSLNGASQITYNGELSNVQAIQNASETRIHGFEFGAKLNLSKSVYLKGQYNIVGGTNVTNGVKENVRHVSPQFGNIHFVWNAKNFKLDAFTVYNSELSYNKLAPSEQGKTFVYALDSNGNPYSPSWYTLNITGQFKVTNGITFTASLANITDQRYKPYSSGIASSGRNLIGSIQYKF